jgi:anthranilate/para-aminobenzoate synthase component I
MSVLARLESKRGFYCGSSLILYKKNVSATINIRSLSLDLKNRVAKYGAGGGITVHSKMRDEFNEMKLKVESFLGLN